MVAVERSDGQTGEGADEGRIATGLFRKEGRPELIPLRSSERPCVVPYVHWLNRKEIDGTATWRGVFRVATLTADVPRGVRPEWFTLLVRITEVGTA